MGNLLKKLKIWFKEKSKATVFGDAYGAFTSLYAKNHYAFFVEMLISLVISIILAGYFMLLVLNLTGENYSMSLWNCFAAWLSKGGFILSIALFAVIQVLIGRFIRLFGIKYRHDDERNIDVATEGTYGTANIMSREEMANTFVMDTLKNNKNTIFGKDPENSDIIVAQKHPLRKINRNCMMIAGPSAGKSACFVIPLLFQIIRRGESAIISDPKSELFAIVSEVAKKCGYEVRIMNLNPMFLENSDPCNFLMYVGDDIDKAQVMSTAIITNTTASGEAGDFWTEGAVNLLQFEMLYINVGTTFKKSQKNLPMVFKWLVENDLETIDSIIENLPDDHPAKAPGMIFSGGEPKVKAQTLQGLRIKLKLFNSPKLRKILSKTEGGLDILNPGRKKCLYFVGSNDQDSSMAPVVSLFYTLLYQELVRYADMRGDRELPVTVHMVLDEYANMGTIPDFEKKLSTVRSRGIVTYIILQDINQLKAKHPLDTWRTVINDCDYFLLMKTNDTETMKWWVEMAGEMTIKVKNSRYSKNKINVVDLHNNETVTEGQGTRQVFTEHEIRTLADDEILVLVSQRNPVKLNTFFWKEHPYGKAVREVQPVQHYPLWRLKEDGIVDDNFDYDNEPSIIMELEADEKIEKDNSYDPDSILKAFGKTSKKDNQGPMVISNLIKKKLPNWKNEDILPVDDPDEPEDCVRVIKALPKEEGELKRAETYSDEDDYSKPLRKQAKKEFTNNMFTDEEDEKPKNSFKKPVEQQKEMNKQEEIKTEKIENEDLFSDNDVKESFDDIFEEFDSFEDFEI